MAAKLLALSLMLLLVGLAPHKQVQAAGPNDPTTPTALPGKAAVGLELALGGESARRNRARVQQPAACTPITGGNAASVVGVPATTSIGFGKRLEWSPGSDAFWAIGRTDVVRFDAASLQQTFVYAGPAVVLDFDPATGVAALTSDQLTIQLRNLFSQQSLGTITPSGQFGAVALSPDDAYVAVSLMASITVELRRTADGSFVRQYSGFSTGSPVYAASFTPDGQSLVWLARARVQVMSLATGAFSPALEHEDFVFDMAFAPGELATAFGEGVRVWNPASGALLDDFRPALGASSVELSPDGSLVFVGDKAELAIYDVASQQLRADFALNAATLSLAPNGCKLLAASADGALIVLQPYTP